MCEARRNSSTAVSSLASSAMLPMACSSEGHAVWQGVFLAPCATAVAARPALRWSMEGRAARRLTGSPAARLAASSRMARSPLLQGEIAGELAVDEPQDPCGAGVVAAGLVAGEGVLGGSQL